MMEGGERGGCRLDGLKVKEDRSTGVNKDRETNRMKFPAGCWLTESNEKLHLEAATDLFRKLQREREGERGGEEEEVLSSLHLSDSQDFPAWAGHR